MKKPVITAIAILITTTALSIERKFLEGYTIEQSRTNTEKAEGGLSLLNGKLAFTRNDTVYLAEMGDSLDIQSITPMPDLSSLGIEGQFTQYGKTIIFSKGGELYQAEQVNNLWGNPQKLKIDGLGGGRTEIKGTSFAARRWTYREPAVKGMYNPALSKNGKRLYYSATFEGGAGGKDIWYSDWNTDRWSAPVNMGERINTSADEDFPFLAGDSAFYFTSSTSDTLTGSNIFKTSLTDRTRPEMIPTAFNTNSNDENFVVVNGCPFLISNRDGNDNIYRPEKQKPVIVETVPADTVPEEAIVKTDTAMKVIRKDYNTCIFYFDFDKTSLIDSYDKEFDYIYEFITSNPDSKYLINGHTDTRGTEKYNKKLSISRAKIVRDRLVKMGVDKSRLVHQGFGELQPEIRDAKTEEEHQKNRRVEIIKLD